MPEFTASYWQRIQEQLRSIDNLPKWSNALISCSYHVLSGSYEVKLHTGHVVLAFIPPDNAKIFIEHTTITDSYLEWLGQQINIAARGPEWNRRLEIRLRALEQYVDTEVIRVSLGHESEYVTVWLTKGENTAVFHHELYLT